MMRLLPNPWLILGVILALAGSWAHGYHVGDGEAREAWAAEAARASANALAEKGRLNEQNRAAESAQAEATRNMETDYANRLKAADAGRDAFERRLNDRLRNAEQNYASCKLSLEAARAGSDESGRSGDIGLGLVSRSAVSRVRAEGKRLQAELALCKAWVRANGR